MVTDAMQAFLDKDMELASHVEAHDDVVDGMFDTVRDKIFSLISEEQNGRAHQAMDLMMIAKYLERIADHATNVAEWVVYSVTGVHEGNLDTKKIP